VVSKTLVSKTLVSKTVPEVPDAEFPSRSEVELRGQLKVDPVVLQLIGINKALYVLKTAFHVISSQVGPSRAGDTTDVQQNPNI
jgi:hypothetical protein